MNTLIHEDNQASSTIQRRKRQEIEDSETERDHRHHDDDTTYLDAMISQTHEDTPDGDRSTDTL